MVESCQTTAAVLPTAICIGCSDSTILDQYMASHLPKASSPPDNTPVGVSVVLACGRSWWGHNLLCHAVPLSAASCYTP
jgi:hypothetical protein